MNDHDHEALIEGLPRSKRGPFDVLGRAAPLTAIEVHAALGVGGDPGSTRTRLLELGKMGLVRQAGRRGKKTLWEVTPAAEVEAAAEAAGKKAPRRRSVAQRDLGERVAEFNALLVDPEVIEALEDPTGSATKRERARARSAIEKARRERRRQLREAEAANHPAVEAIRQRKAVQDAGDLIRSLRVFGEEEHERRVLLGQELVADAEWERILRAIQELERHSGDLYEHVARMIGAPSRVEVDVEYEEGEVEDADYDELGNGSGSAPVAELIERLGGTARLALPPGKA
jgi:hypothetical protein